MGLDPLPAPPHVFAVRPDGLLYARFLRDDSGHFALAEQHAQSLPQGTFSSGPLGGAPKSSELEEALTALLAAVSGTVDEASLVLPDAWLRLVFLEAGDLPSSLDARLEVLRWKLKRVLPVRVEDLRLDACEVTPLPQQEEPNRVLVGFALEPLLAAVEAAFSGRGVRIGRIVAETPALLPTVQDGIEEKLAGLVLVRRDSYTLLFANHGEPVLYRHKTLDGTGELRHGQMVRDLKLTRAFLHDQLPSEDLAAVFLAASPQEQGAWVDGLEEGLGTAAEVLDESSLSVSGGLGVAPWLEWAPLLGAVCQEVR